MRVYKQNYDTTLFSAVVVLALKTRTAVENQRLLSP